MDDALPIAIEARESSKAAHHRLDRMNGSIDRLGNEMVDTKKELGGAIKEVSDNVNAILLKLAGEDGAAKARGVFILTRRFVISTCVVLLTSSIAATAITLLLRRHTG